MAAAVGGNYLLRYNSSTLHVIELELLRMTKMLKNLSVFIGYRDSHIFGSFLNDIFRSLIVEPIVSAPDHESFPLY